MAISLQSFTFGQITWARNILAGLAMGAIVLLTRTKLPRIGRNHLHFAVIGLTSNVIPHLGFGFGQNEAPSALAAMFNATSPLAAALLAALVFKVERLTLRRALIIAVGVLGVFVIVGPWKEVLAGDLIAQLSCLVAGVSYAFSVVYTRRFVTDRGIPVLGMAFLNTAWSAVIVIALTPLLLPYPVHWDWAAVIAIAWIGVVVTGVAQVWNLNVLNAWGPVAVSTVTYLIPVVALVLGVVVLREELEWNQPVGAAIVVFSVIAMRLRPRRLRLRRGTPRPPAAPESPRSS